MMCHQMKHIYIMSFVMAAFLFSSCTTHKTKSVETYYIADGGGIKAVNEHGNNVFVGDQAAGVLGDHVTNVTNQAFVMAGVTTNKFSGRIAYLPNPKRNDADDYWEVAYGDRVRYVDSIQNATKTLINLNVEAGNFELTNLNAVGPFVDNYRGPSLQESWHLVLTPIRKKAVEKYRREIARTPALQGEGLLQQFDQRYHNASNLFAGTAGGTPYRGLYRKDDYKLKADTHIDAGP